MTLIKLYIRTETEADLRSACPFLLDENGNWHKDTSQFSLAILGVMPPVYDVGNDGELGEILKPGDNRFHANLLVTQHTVVEMIPSEIVIVPNNPILEWSI